jgi:endonuclease III-like uncharacterized protein
VLTGVGQMAAESLLYYVARRGIHPENIYLSALVVHVLSTEMHGFGGSGGAVLMEADAT